MCRHGNCGRTPEQRAFDLHPTSGSGVARISPLIPKRPSIIIFESEHRLRGKHYATFSRAVWTYRRLLWRHLSVCRRLMWVRDRQWRTLIPWGKYIDDVAKDCVGVIPPPPSPPPHLPCPRPSTFLFFWSSASSLLYSPPLLSLPSILFIFIALIQTGRFNGGALRKLVLLTWRFHLVEDLVSKGLVKWVSELVSDWLSDLKSLSVWCQKETCLAIHWMFFHKRHL